MSLYKHSITGEERDLDPQLVQAWIDAGNPKGQAWQPYTPPAPEPAAPVVPEFVRSAQLRQWLIDADLLATVEAIFDNAGAWPDEKTQLKAKTRWDFEVNVRRDDPLVVSLGPVLGLTSDQIDAAFIAAAQIP